MNDNSFTLHPHGIKLCRVTYKTYHMDARQTKLARIVYVANITSTPSYYTDVNGENKVAYTVI